jgi:diguanylate cyclase (GGDEF)-like protein
MIHTWFADASIRRKLTIVTTLTTTVAVLLAAAALGTYEIVTFRRALSQKLTALADVVGRNCTAALAFHDRSVANDVLAALTAEPGVEEGAVYDRDGQQFARYVAAGKTSVSPPMASLEAGTRFEKGRLVVARPIVLDGEPVGTVYIWSSLDELTTRAATFIGVMLGIVGGCTFLALFISSRLQHWISKPILDLAHVARLVTSDRNFAARAQAVGRDEVGLLVEDFNRMLTEIQQQDHRLREHQEQLAVQVERRTAELVVANEQLVASVRRVESYADQIAQMTELAQLLQSCQNRDEVFRVVRHEMPKLFSTESGSLAVLNSSRNLMETVASWGGSPPASQTFGPEECWAFRRGRPHVVAEMESPLRCAHLTATDGPVTLCVPMTAQGESVGILQFRLASADEAGGEDESGVIRSTRVRLAVTLGEHIALALANLRLREQLRNQTIHDPLTGLFNRRYLEDALERECRRSARSKHPLTLVMIDVDHFKTFNDTWGHEGGDLVLRELAALMRSHFRGEDVVCRYGGEEFVILLAEASSESARSRVDELRMAVHFLAVRHREQSIGSITISAGLATMPEHGTTPAELIQAADRALYKAKKVGRDTVAGAEPTGGATPPATDRGEAVAILRSSGASLFSAPVPNDNK